MLTETDDDFFFEEDKIGSSHTAESASHYRPLLLLHIDDDASPAAAPHHEQRFIASASFELLSNANDNGDHHDVAAASGNGSPPALAVDDLDVTEIVCTAYCAGDRMYDFGRQTYELERLGMTVTASSVVIKKDDSNLIGISIGGGAPLCPCLYIVQVFDGTPAAREGSLQSGDELLAVNSVSVKGKTKVEVAKMIQAATNEVIVHFNKLHADPEQGKSLDIILKKLKHRMVDAMSSNTADTLGLSRAILCNDSLVKRLEELEGTELMYKGLVEHARRMLKAYYDLLQTYKAFGDCFTQISAREPQQRASEAFRTFGEFHRTLEKDGLRIIKQVTPVLADLGTYLNKAIPDTKLTVRRYADAKFTYLSYCLKVKEMDDEEHGFAGMQEPLYRVETGNYEYRLILRCRQDARSKFAKLRTDVLEKMELLECKHATDLNKQLRSLLDSLAELNGSIVERMDVLPSLFPIEVDFKDGAFQYTSSTLKPQELDDDDEEEQQQGEFQSYQANTAASSSLSSAGVRSTQEVVCGLEAVEQPAAVLNVAAMAAHLENQHLIAGLESATHSADSVALSDPQANANNLHTNELLLKELGLFGVDLMAQPQTLKQPTGAANGASAYDFDLFLNQSGGGATQLEQDLMSNNAQEMDLLLQ